MKRTIALFAAFLLVLSLLPLYSLADGDDTETLEPQETVVADSPTPSAPPETDPKSSETTPEPSEMTPEPSITQAPASESPSPEALFIRLLDCDSTDSNGVGYLEVPCAQGDPLSLEVKCESNGDLAYRWQVLVEDSNLKDPYTDIDSQVETTADEKALDAIADAANFGVENYYRCVVTATNGEEAIEQYCYFTLVNDEIIQTSAPILIESFADLGDAANMNVPANMLAEDITFPSVLVATISGSNADVAVTWIRSDASAAWENGGNYVFTPILPDEYSLSVGVETPFITVSVAQQDSLPITKDELILSTASSGDGVLNRINSLKSLYPNLSYFSVNGSACNLASGETVYTHTCSNCELKNIIANRYPNYVSAGLNDAWTCVAFARFAYYYLFGLNTANIASNSSVVDINDAKIGDFVKITNISHVGIFLYQTDSRVYLYDTNGNVASPSTNRVSYGGSGYAKTNTFTVYHANNYDSINGTVNTTPTAPVAQYPDGGSFQSDQSITFQWSDVGASLYRLEIYQNSSNVIPYSVGGTSKTCIVPTPGTWHWKVSSMQNTTTVLATSYEKTFTVTAAPSGGTGTSSIPTLQSPDDGKGFAAGSSITFQWNNTGAPKYKIEFICDTNPSRTYYLDNIQGTSCTRSFSAADNWRWQVRSYNGNDYGAAPHTRSFVVNAPASSNVGGGVNVKYYNGVELSGNVLYETNVGSIHYDWGNGSPGGGVPVDAFSARFTQTANFNEGYYKFHYEVDDCIKIWIDGDCKVNQWSAHVLNEYSSAIYITGGNHTIWVDYADINGEAKIIVDVGSCATPTMTLKTPTNEAVCTTNDTVQFAWNGVDIPGRYRVELTNETTGESKYFLTSKDTPYGQPFATLSAGKWHWRVLAMSNLATVLVYSPYGYFTVTTPPPTVPDLEPTAITSSYIDGYLYFDSGIRNNTGITSNVFNVKWYVNGVLKAYTSHTGIQGNSTVYDGNNSFYFKPTASGTYNITYTIDADNHIAESNESNNTTTTQATIQIPAPLSISSVNADLSAANIWDTVTWTVGTTGGVGVKQYYYMLYCGTKLVNTPVWTTQPTFKSTLIDKGSYTLKVSVKDNSTTLTRTSAVTTVTIPLSLTSVSTSASVVGTGTRITWNANTTGGAGAKQYSFILYKDGVLLKQSTWSTAPSYAYTPTTIGSYYVTASVKDSSGSYSKDSVPTKAVTPFTISAIECSDDSSGFVTEGNASSPYELTGTELTWTVTTSGGDGDVVYYYKLYNGTTLINTPEWTMQSSYTYTPTTAGTYTLRVTAKENTGTVTKSSVATKVIVPLSISSITPSSLLSTTGKVLSWSIKATGGDGAKYYLYKIYRDGSMIKQSLWTTSSSYFYTPTSVGVYSVNVAVKDLSDSLSRNSISNKVVLPFVIQSVSCSSNYSTIGTMLTWSITTTGGDGSIQYYYKLYNGATLVNTPVWGSVASFSYTPTTAGSYSLKVYAKENTGAPSKASSTTKVIIPLSIASVTPSKTIAVTGAPITWNVKTVGGDGTKRYYYELYCNGTMIQSKTWGTLASFGFTPTVAGQYNLFVMVKDISGILTKESDSVQVVLPIAITSIEPSTLATNRGQQITWTVSATEGDGVKQYYYQLYNGISLMDTISWTPSNIYSYTPTRTGSYSLKVYVKDNTPTVSKSSAAVKVY